MYRRTFIFIVSLLVFVVLTIDASTAFITQTIDLGILAALQDSWTPDRTVFVYALSDLSGEAAVISFAVVILIILIIRRRWNLLLFHISALIGSLFIFSFMKALIGRERPLTKISEVPQMSFPSGHATMSMTMAAILYFLLKYRVKPSFRTVLFCLCASFPLMISFTRVYLNVHYPSDVIAGMALGLIWIIILSKIYLPEDKNDYA